MKEAKTVAILGASPEAGKFANRAMRKLQEFGHTTLLVNPNFPEIDGQKVYASLNDIRQPVDTLTLYVGPAKLEPMINEILDLRPQRVIFNPGTESATAIKTLTEHMIKCVRGCTLVMLDSGTF